MMEVHPFGLDYIKTIDTDIDGNCYQLLYDVKFTMDGLDIGRWKLFYHDTVVAKAENNILTVYKGFKWDGCTFIGKYYENAATVQGSMWHDILYNAHKNQEGKKVPYNLFQVDLMFLRLMNVYAKKFTVVPYVYYLGMTIGGLPWKWGKNLGYTIKYLD